MGLPPLHARHDGLGLPVLRHRLLGRLGQVHRAVGGGDPPKWTQSVDFRLEKRFVLGGSVSLSLFAEGINVFNYTNEKDYDGFKPALPDVNANFGKAGNGYNPQRLQFGASFAF